MRSLLCMVVLLGGCGDDGGATPDAPPITIDAPAAKDPCSTCGRDQLCVQRFDGICNLTTACVTTTMRCMPGTCSTACEAAFCMAPYQCMNRPPCGSESPVAFTCYGP